MDDLPITELLSSRGFEGEGARRALETLYREGLTRLGKTRIAAAKVEAVDRVLGRAFVRHCRKPACRPPPGEAREAVSVSAACCETCGGSDNRRAVERMLAATERAGWTRLLVAGGSPGARRAGTALRRPARPAVRHRRHHASRRTVAPLLDRSDLVAIWTSTEISHKATAVLRGPKVLKVPRRGVAALAEAVRKRRVFRRRPARVRDSRPRWRRPQEAGALSAGDGCEVTFGRAWTLHDVVVIFERQIVENGPFVRINTKFTARS